MVGHLLPRRNNLPAAAVVPAPTSLARNLSAEAAAPVLDAGRAAFAALSGMPAAEVVYTTGALHALDLLLGSWPADRRKVACLPGEYGPNLAVLGVHGFDRQLLPTRSDG